MSDDWTVECHLNGKPAEVIALYDRFVELATRCGPFTYAVAKTAITLKGSRRGFAGAAPGAGRQDRYFDLQRHVEGPQIQRSSPYTKKLFAHQFRVTRLDQLDDDFAAWIAEAYEVGQGAHLNRPQGNRAG